MTPPITDKKNPKIRQPFAKNTPIATATTWKYFKVSAYKTNNMSANDTYQTPLASRYASMYPPQIVVVAPPCPHFTPRRRYPCTHLLLYQSQRQLNTANHVQSAGSEMKTIFSARERASTWRLLWLDLAEAEKELGIPISDEAIQQLKDHVTMTDEDFKIAIEEEKRFVLVYN